MAYVIFGALKTGRIERGGYIIDRRADPSRFRLNLWIAELVFLLGMALCFEAHSLTSTSRGTATARLVVDRPHRRFAH
jgi:hypothetical protein